MRTGMSQLDFSVITNDATACVRCVYGHLNLQLTDRSLCAQLHRTSRNGRTRTNTADNITTHTHTYETHGLLCVMQ